MVNFNPKDRCNFYDVSNHVRVFNYNLLKLSKLMRNQTKNYSKKKHKRYNSTQNHIRFNSTQNYYKKKLEIKKLKRKKLKRFNRTKNHHKKKLK